jgi:hypothetical protein
MAAGAAGANLILGTDEQANVAVLQDGNVAIQAGNVGGTKTWTFGTIGSTIFPTLTTQRGDTNGGTITGQTLLFGDATQEAVISTPDGSNADGINSQRLVINPGKGEDSNGGEGGDIYLWAGATSGNNRIQTVYKATHPLHRKEVAVKVVKEQYAPYVKPEVDFLAKMQPYPNFPRLYDTWTNKDGCFCIAMECVDATLEDVILGDTDITLSNDDRYFIIEELAEAIKACHDQHIVHFDIKAANIGLTLDGRVMLLDFGLAENFKTVQSPSFQKGIADGYILKVSKEHRPIEAFLCNHPLTEKADVWAFAVVAYDIFTGLNLFDVDEFCKTGQAELPDNLGKEVPADIEDLIQQCTQANPSDRPNIEKWCA